MSGTPPELSAYTERELAAACAWPAIERYLHLIQKSGDSPQDRLRLKRHEAWLRCAVATFFDRVPAESVCSFWSKASEELLTEAWRLSGCDKMDFALLALGKLGSEELNLSSDVDLILIRQDQTHPDLKAFRDFQATLSDLTAFGFCLRTDFSLRPGGKGAAAIPSLSEFEHHYGYHGEMWERLAYVRMRVLEGKDDLKKAILSFSRKFSFRRHLDFTLLEDLRSLRAKIRSEKYERQTNTFHLKLGEGGIRELELFVHALQVIHGGRHPALQTHSTTRALSKIKELRLLPVDECDFLLQAYWYLRTLENRLHAFEDQQTYLVDLEKGHPALPEGFSEQLKATTRRVTQIASSLFGEDVIDSPIPSELEHQKTWLKDLGFSTESCEQTWPEILAATALSRRSEADEKQRLEFLHGLISKLSELQLDRDLGLSLTLDFVRAIRAKASFFTLLNREARVRDELASLFSISPYLGSILASRPELVDEFILRKQASPSADLDTLLEELTERRLLAELISASQFLRDQDLRKLTENLSGNADGICQTLLDRLKEDLGGGSIGLLALGKWGGRELGLRSDLDFVFVTPGPPSATDQKLSRRFLARMTEAHRGGSIYAIDMRLRPSGSAGPILVEEAELKDYLEVKAAAWERQAYLRARPLAQLSFEPGRTAAARGLNREDREELRRIRSQLFTTGKHGELDLKLTYGGLADVEFAAQIALLARREFALDPSTSGMIQCLEGIDANWKSIGPALRLNYENLRRIEQLYQLTTSQSGSKVRVRSDEFKRLAMVMKTTSDELDSQIQSIFERIRETLASVKDLEE